MGLWSPVEVVSTNLCFDVSIPLKFKALVDMDYTRLKEEITKSEGLKLKAYQLQYNTADGPVKEPFYTIGIGHRVKESDKIDVNKEYNYDFINKLFEVDFSIAKGGADELLGNCHPMAKEAGIECVFVLGKNGFSKFKKTIQLIKDGQHHDASEEIKNSKWYRQVPHRVEEISRKLREI